MDPASRQSTGYFNRHWPIATVRPIWPFGPARPAKCFGLGLSVELAAAVLLVAATAPVVTSVGKPIWPIRPRALRQPKLAAQFSLFGGHRAPPAFDGNAQVDDLAGRFVARPIGYFGARPERELAYR